MQFPQDFTARERALLGSRFDEVYAYATLSPARGVTVNMVAPGFIDTDMTAVLSDKVKETMVQEIPMRKMGRPEDVAGAVLFLVSDCSSYITGQVVNVDGGMVM